MCFWVTNKQQEQHKHSKSAGISGVQVLLIHCTVEEYKSWKSTIDKSASSVYTTEQATRVKSERDHLFSLPA